MTPLINYLSQCNPIFLLIVVKKKISVIRSVNLIIVIVKNVTG